MRTKNSLAEDKYKIAFVNQSTGSLFKELVEDLSLKWYPSILYTGFVMGKFSNNTNGKLDVELLNPHIRKSNISRLTSGLGYFFHLFKKSFKKKHNIMFIISNPPYIIFLGLILKKLIGQRYIILVYDIYPDILIGLKSSSNSNIFIKIWRILNKITYENSDAVITIGNNMKNTLVNQFDPQKTVIGEIIVIPNCADPDYVNPIPKKNNLFAKKFQQIDKITVMYSGNFGNAHSFNIILKAAKTLLDQPKINFFLIGEGIKKKYINDAIKLDNLINVISLPFQNNFDFPKSISCADIAIITMAIGSENLMVPGKIYYSMAVGSALIGITGSNSELEKIITKFDCGLVVDPENEEALKNAILYFKKNKWFLDRCKRNSHAAFLKYYTRQNTTEQYFSLLENIYIRK